MRNKKWLTLLVLLLTVAFLVAACGTKEQNQSQAPAPSSTSDKKEAPSSGSSRADWPKSVQIATASSKGTGYLIGGAMATLVQKHLGLPASAQTTQGFIENVRLLSGNTVNLSLMDSSTGLQAVLGKDPFVGENHKDFRSLLALPPLELHIITQGNKNINSVKDLKGKKVAIGAPGSGNNQIAQLLFGIAGIKDSDYKGLDLSQADSFTAMQDGNIDAMFYSTNSPNANVAALASKHNIKILSIDPDISAQLIKENPDLIEHVIKKGTYPTIDTDVRTLAKPMYLIAKESMSSDFIYSVTKTILENIKEVEAAHVLLKSVNKEKALVGLPIPLHEGARKYFEEIKHPGLSKVPTKMP